MPERKVSKVFFSQGKEVFFKLHQIKSFFFSFCLFSGNAVFFDHLFQWVVRDLSYLITKMTIRKCKQTRNLNFVRYNELR